jgi:polysaccharide biosynthesis transport protein
VLFVMEYVDTSLKTTQIFKKFTGLDLIGTVNNLESRFTDPDFLYGNKKNSQKTEDFREQLRKIRFEIERQNAKVILITSTKEKEGKTFIASCLAHSFSLTNKKVLLIDSNFRNNGITRIFDARPVFEKYLKGECPPDQLITKTRIPGIDVIGNSGSKQSPSELFSVIPVYRILNQFAPNYDFIIMEGACLNKYSDARELAMHVEKVIPVFSAQSGIKQADRNSLEFLKRLAEKLSGGILNRINKENQDE